MLLLILVIIDSTPPTMMTLRRLPLLIAVYLLSFGSALANEDGAKNDSSENEARAFEVGRHAEITGAVRSVLVMERFGHVIIRFEDHKVYLFCRSENVGAVFGGKPADQAVGRGDQITARGRVELYRDEPQIVLRTADQITLPERNSDN